MDQAVSGLTARVAAKLAERESIKQGMLRLRSDQQQLRAELAHMQLERAQDSEDLQRQITELGQELVDMKMLALVGMDTNISGTQGRRLESGTGSACVHLPSA